MRKEYISEFVLVSCMGRMGMPASVDASNNRGVSDKVAEDNEESGRQYKNGDDNVDGDDTLSAVHTDSIGENESIAIFRRRKRQHKPVRRAGRKMKMKMKRWTAMILLVRIILTPLVDLLF
ncbi:unnamed protein product [Angiostrongylus costaricensis]|uniref:Transmembrane protein n=1 Tax=Angiostrongylus costaricensis TaxID=334426 RepID=A0A0R3Q212_ANGCS|nr:unnamed protein product [Angiostrongylus costaricensis]